ncbi:hypothetical protein [Mariniblastus fucicola]|uniref:Anti-sigma-28 factor FlgM C-terminal domain-containing protein n=1 Tax=Mariniblastus fucicola TaxID=980251 RepID=A0A5B9PDS4_9BACT|nr:hypothetical protein [Mariniblastus fucicola]QEG23355.1 hypothetical protein MFFC18_32530 [Mariniblastus fucicola]
MEINNGNNLLRPHIQSQQTQAKVGHVSSQAASGPEGASTSIDTSSVEMLNALLGGGSEVRESLVQEIKLKIEVGEYLTQKSAVDAADAILNL